MISMFIGIIMIAFTVVAAMPTGLNWGDEIVFFLKGCAPVFAAFVGIVAIFIGIADLKDRSEARKEEQAAQSQEK
ncbi:MAG: hypothetical protein ACRC5H_04020 [Treponemataceae bacterium]